MKISIIRRFCKILISIEYPIDKDLEYRTPLGHMEAHTVNAFGKEVRLVGDQAKSLTWQALKWLLVVFGYWWVLGGAIRRRKL